MRINGVEVGVRDGDVLSDVLSSNGYSTDRTAVELNGSIVPKRDYPTTVVRDGDSVEVVSFVGGG